MGKVIRDKDGNITGYLLTPEEHEHAMALAWQSYDEELAADRQPWDAVVEATRHRMRPILLTAAAASLGMIPIAREVFWAPMAFAMIGGILAATLLTLVFLPALYVAWFRVKEPADEPAADGEPCTVPV